MNPDKLLACLFTEGAGSGSVADDLEATEALDPFLDAETRESNAEDLAGGAS